MVSRIEHASASETVADQSDSAVTSTEHLERWLDALVRLVRLSESERQAIRDELAEHLHDRVHDLMLAGRDEQQAVHEALNELGDLAVLAARLKNAHRKHWRTRIMNASAIALGIGIVGLGAVTFIPGGSENAVVFTPRQQPSPLSELQNVTVTMEHKTTLREFIATLNDSMDAILTARWNDLMLGEITRDTPIGVTFEQTVAAEAMKILGEHLEREFGTVEWRYPADNRVELGLQEVFDKRETVLVSYRIDGILDTMMHQYDKDYNESCSAVQGIVLDFVEPAHWLANGGRRAKMNVVNDRLFVEAPPRMQHGVQWILQQLQNGNSPQSMTIDKRSLLLRRPISCELAAHVQVHRVRPDGLRRFKLLCPAHFLASAPRISSSM